MNLVNLNLVKPVDKTDSHPALRCHLVNSDASAISCQQQPVWALLQPRDSTQVLLTALLLLDKKGIYFLPISAGIKSYYLPKRR